MRSGRTEPMTHCKKCHNAGCKVYADKNFDKIKNRNLKQYGITLEQYNKLFDQQDGKCCVCDKHQSESKRALAVDHDHETGEIRGLLCDNCNRGIGLLGDSISLLEKTIVYLKRSKLKVVSGD